MMFDVIFHPLTQHLYIYALFAVYTFHAMRSMVSHYMQIRAKFSFEKRRSTRFIRDDVWWAVCGWCVCTSEAIGVYVKNEKHT